MTDVEIIGYQPFVNDVKDLIHKKQIGEFEAEYAGKMQLYLAALDEQVKLPEENSSIGIIVCKSKDKIVVEYALKQSNAPIGVAAWPGGNSKTIENI